MLDRASEHLLEWLIDASHSGDHSHCPLEILAPALFVPTPGRIRTNLPHIGNLVGQFDELDIYARFRRPLSDASCTIVVSAPEATDQNLFNTFREDLQPHPKV